MDSDNSHSTGLKVLLIIPCYNEARSIGGLLKTISTLSYDSLVVDDGSKDETKNISSDWTTCISLPFNLGIGGAVQAGVKYAIREKYRHCCGEKIQYWLNHDYGIKISVSTIYTILGEKYQTLRMANSTKVVMTSR